MTAELTAIKGPKALANEAPKPVAAEEATYKLDLVPFEETYNFLVAIEALLRELTAFLVSTLKVTILSAT